MTINTPLTITELARLLGIRSYQLRYAYQQEHLPEPPRIAGKRVYGPDEVEQVRRYAERHGLASRRRGRPASSPHEIITEQEGLRS